MSICINKQRKQYFISYKEKLSNGDFKTYNIYNKDWKLSVGKKYMKAIEPTMIEEDRKRRKLHLAKGKNTTFGDIVDMFVSECYLVSKRQTAYAKELAINKYVLTIFDENKPIDDVMTIQNMERFKQQVVAANLCQRRMNSLFRYLKELIEFASDREFLSYEFGRRLTCLLKPIKSQKVKEEKLVFWTPEQFDLFINTFEKNDPFKMLFEVAYQCALRMGELLALQWEDINFDKHTISINKSIDNLGTITSTKNQSSNALVSISNSLCKDLEQYKIDFMADNNKPVFFATGRTSRTTIRRKMASHIEKAGVPYIKFHGLRHSCASLMINKGCSPLIVSKHLRHSSTRETLDTYSHLFPTETEGIIDKIFM